MAKLLTHPNIWKWASHSPKVLYIGKNFQINFMWKCRWYDQYCHKNSFIEQRSNSGWGCLPFSDNLHLPDAKRSHCFMCFLCKGPFAMCTFKPVPTGEISTLDGTPLKLVNKFTFLGSSISSTAKDIDTRLMKAWTALSRLSIIW